MNRRKATGGDHRLLPVSLARNGGGAANVKGARSMSEVTLPGLIARLSRPFSEIVVLVAGGRAPGAEWLRRAAAGRPLWAADRGIAACRRAGLIPRALLGDRDSAAAEDWAWAEGGGAKTETFPREKDLTDTQLALARIKAASPAAFILLTGALGGRLDHLYSALRSLAACGLPGCLADEAETVFLLTGGNELALAPVAPPLALSLLPLSPVVSGVTFAGVRWPLADATLRADAPYAVSNRLTGDGCRLTIATGQMALYLAWQEIDR